MIPLLASAHQDLTQFKDPDCINPTNFLNDKGELQSNNSFMPFAPGLGWARRGPAWTCRGVHGFLTPHPHVPRKAMCLGAGLARSEIFLTSILQQFCLLPVGSPTNIDPTPQCTGLGNVPPAFQLCLVAAEVRFSHPLLTGSQTSLPSSINKGPELQMEGSSYQQGVRVSQMCAALR